MVFDIMSNRNDSRAVHRSRRRRGGLLASLATVFVCMLVVFVVSGTARVGVVAEDTDSTATVASEPSEGLSGDRAAATATTTSGGLEEDASTVGPDGGATDVDAGLKKRRRKKSTKNKPVATPAPSQKEAEKSELGEGESAVGSIHEAIDDDDMDELEDLLTWKPNLREKCQKLGETRHFVPIMKAAYLGNARAMDLLIDYGANVNEVDTLGYSVLMRSVMAKCSECVQILVDAGAVVNYVQKTAYMDFGFTALKLSQLVGHQEIYDILVAGGADTGESGGDKRRRLRRDQQEEFKATIEDEGIDVDVDELLSMTSDKLLTNAAQDNEVVVNVDGTNTTMKQSEASNRTLMAEKLKEAKKKASEQETTTGNGEAARECDADAALEEGGKSCAFDPTAPVKDEL